MNLFYFLSLIFIYFTYSYLLKEFLWRREWPHIIYYFIAFAIVGVSFNYFLEPNYFKAIYEILTNQFTFKRFSILVVSSSFWIGWAIIFSQVERFTIEKLQLEYTPKSIREYLLYFFIYMLFLNSLTVIINYTFRRPV